jgi:hypothetical protein
MLILFPPSLFLGVILVRISTCMLIIFALGLEEGRPRDVNDWLKVT